MPMHVCGVCGGRALRSVHEICGRRREQARQARQPYRIVYRDPRWRKVRLAALERDGGRCTHLDAEGRRCGRIATEVHHVVPISSAERFGLDVLEVGLDLANLASVCPPHNPRGGRA